MDTFAHFRVAERSVFRTMIRKILCALRANEVQLIILDITEIAGLIAVTAESTRASTLVAKGWLIA